MAHVHEHRVTLQRSAAPEKLCALADGLFARLLSAHNQPGATPDAAGDGVIDSLAQAFTALPDGAWLSAHHDLTPLDRALLGLLLALEYQPGFGNACAYLQGDAARQRPTIDLALQLLGLPRPARLEALAALPHGPLLRHALVEVDARAAAGAAARGLRLDSQILALFLPQPGVDASLACFSRFGQTTGGLTHSLLDEPARSMLKQALASPVRLLRVHVRGAAGSGKAQLAAALAAELQIRLLDADLAALPPPAHEQARLLSRLCREAWLRGALLYCHGLERLDDAARPECCAALVGALAEHPVHCVIGMPAAWPTPVRMPGGLMRVEMPRPTAAHRAGLWQAAARAHARHIEPTTAQALAARFQLSALQIEQAVDDVLRVQPDAPTQGTPMPLGFAPCAAAARALSGQALEEFARRVAPSAGWPHLIVPTETEQQLREISQRVQQRARLAQQWGSGNRLTTERGVTALFAGPSGTGKTLAAEVIAADLGLDLFCVDLALIVSKYIGETEKNLDRVFEAAQSANAVLFFDEADALFGKRSEVKDAHDRYANLEIAYLLQKMEQFDGLAVLATNLRQNIDDAFTRRVTFAVNFPFPQEAERLRLWQAHWPVQLERGEQVDFDELARGLPLAGGNIRNLVLAAAHYATSDNSAVERRHLLRATRREYQKMGKTLNEADWQRLGFAHTSAAERAA